MSARRLPDHPAFRRPPVNHAKRLARQAMVAVVLLAIAGLSVFTWQQNRAMDLQTEIGDLQHQLAGAQANRDSLTTKNDAGQVARPLGPGVALLLPDGWQLLPGVSDCPPPRGNLVCEGRQVVVPSDVSDQQFSVDITLYQNRQNAYAKTWFLNTYATSDANAAVTEQSIGGHSAALWLRGDSPQDAYYVVSAAGHSAVVHTRVFDPSGQGQDFRSRLPDIEALAAAIQFVGAP